MEDTPQVTTKSTMWYSETLTGEKTQVAYTEEIPQLEEAPDAITATVLDLDYELSQPGIRKASQIEIPILYTHTQHKRLRQLDKDKEYHWFFKLPQSTVGETGQPLVRHLTGKIRTTIDTLSGEDFIKDKITIYKTSDVTETEGFPTANN